MIVAMIMATILLVSEVSANRPGGAMMKRITSAAMRAVETARTHLIISLSSSRPSEKKTPSHLHGSVAKKPIISSI